MLNKNSKSGLQRLNKILRSEFYNKYPQYKGRNLTLSQMKNITTLYKKYPEFKGESLNDDFLGLNLTNVADTFFSEHKEYKGKLLMGDVFIVKSFFANYPNLQDSQKIWSIEDIEKITNEYIETLTIDEGDTRIKEINSFYSRYPEYIGVYLNKSERKKIENFITKYPDLNGQKWSLEAIEQFDKMELGNRQEYTQYVNDFYKKYPEYKGDYLEKGRILTLSEMYKIADFLDINQDLSGYKWDVKAIDALENLSPDERAIRLKFYRKNPEVRARYVNEELFNYEKEHLEYSSKLQNRFIGKVKEFVSSIKLRNFFGKRFTKKQDKQAELDEDNLTYRGIAIKVLEKYPIYKGTKLNKKQMELLSNYFKDDKNPEIFLSLKAIERLDKSKYNQEKGYVTFREGYDNGYAIIDSLTNPQSGKKFYKNNPEYIGYPMLSNELENAILFCKKFPELKGVVWAPQEMKEVLKLPLQQQRKIREFYKANPYYKQSGILLLPKTIEKINEIYTIYPEQKGKVLNEKEVKSLYRKARWINIQKEFNKIKNWQKETKQQDKFIKEFYKDNPQYMGVELKKEEVEVLKEFFKEYPYYKGDNITPADATRLKNFFDKNPEYKVSKLRAEDIYIANSFLANYPKLRNGKRWDVESMEKFINENIGDKEKATRDRAINVFYDKNPEYKGIYLDRDQRAIVSKFFREYPELKSDKPWKIETIEKFNNGTPQDKKEYVNQFYANNPEYKGEYLQIDEMDKIDKFFEKHPEIERSNWEVKAIDDFEGTGKKDMTPQDIQKEQERILAIYKANPHFNGVYLSEPAKKSIEIRKDTKEDKRGISSKFGNNKTKGNGKELRM